MADAQLEKTVVNISAPKIKEEFVASGEVIKFDGFKVYMESTDDESQEDCRKEYYLQ